MLHTQLGHALQGLAAVDDAGGVAGVVDDDHLGFGGDVLGQNVAVDLEAVLRPQGDGDHHAAGLGDHILIVHKGGGEDDDLVPLVDGGHKGHVHRLCAAAGEQHLSGGVIVQVKVPAEILGDLGAQAQGAAVGGIVGLVLQQGLDGLFLDEVWGVEIGLAGGWGRNTCPPGAWRRSCQQRS